jgi:hypothetical protein
LARRKEEVVEDQDRKTPEEEADVEGHALDPEFGDPEFGAKDEDDFEAHSLRDPEFGDPEFGAKGDDKDPEFG